MRTYTANHNATYINKHGQTPYQTVHNTPWPGEILAFGQFVEYQATRYEIQQLRIHPMDKKTLSGIFLEYEIKQGGIWTGNVWVLSRDKL